MRYRSFLLCVLLVAAATSAVAQSYAFPASTPNTDVLCSTCPGRETLMTVGYPPVLRFVGRWADSEIAKDYQQPFRTARPKAARFVPSRNRLYTILGSALAAYDTDKFFSRLNARPQEAMQSATGVPTAGGNPRYAIFGPPEVFLWWDSFFYAENGGGWITPIEDGLERLWDFDWDDRGNVYLAYSVFGWGIVKDSGEEGGGWLHTISQTVRVNSLTPDHIMSLKTSDGHYYAAVSDKNLSSLLQIWDVQDPAVPVKLPDIQGRSFYLWAKDSTSSRLGIVEYSGGLSIYTSDAFVRSGTPLAHFEAGGGGTFRLITSDGTNFYAYGASGSGPFLDVISPSGSTYVEKRSPTNGYGIPQGMHYGDGYLAIYGGEINVGASNIRVFKVGTGGTLTEIPFEMPVPGSNGTRQLPFWSMYYGANSPQGYTHPYYNIFMDVAPVKVGSKIYIVIAAYGLGDVWEIKAGDSLSARLTAAADVVNPHSTAASGTGPFYGDRQTFTSSLSSGNVGNVTWDYGDNTTDSSVTNGVVKHQYGGITSLASLPLVRHATASNSLDLTMNDTVAVTLAAPQARFQLANTSYLFRQPDASSTAPIVVGDSFFDASDGSVEGHYTDWVLDGASNKKLPSEAFSAGTCGAHSLAFNTHYGPYSGAGSAMTGTSDLPLSISPFVYTVRPYVITVQEPGPASVGDPNAVFTTALRMAGANDLPGGVGTAVTYKWEVIDGNQTSILNAAGTATLGTIPSFSVPRTTFSTLGLRVRLSTTVAASAVPGTGCSSLASAVAQSSELNGPDPVIVKTGCVTVGGPCSFTVTSTKNPTLAGWSFAWTVNPSVTSQGTTAAVFAPQFTTTTDYSVGVTVTNGIGSKTATLSGQHIDKPLCSSAPDNINNAIGINSNTVPNPGDSVTFIMFPRGWVPSVECDKFAWTFGDSGSSTDMVPSHVYNSAGTYNVSLVLTGALATNTYTTTVTIGTVAPPPPPPPPPNSCNAPLANSAYVAYTGPASGCTPVTTSGCNPGESVQFVLWPDSGFNLNCATTSITWSFGDNTNGSGISPTHIYSVAGIYHAQATVSNSGGSFTYPQDVKVGSVQPTQCGTLTQQSVAVGFTGPGCTEVSGTCSAGSVAFRPVGTGYDFNCNATHSYDWDFGDGSAHSTQAQPAHTFGTGTFTVKLLVSNGTSSTTVTRSIVIGSSGNPGTGGSCAAIIPDGNDYVTFFGDGCNAISGNCSAKADIAFDVNATGYDFSCATHTYSWDFGDGGHATGKTPLHRYTADGTYHVIVHFSNGSATADLNATVKVTGATPVAPRGGHAVRH
ncbi:MAG: PKD domain-containing protein [Thermoanaerobaculia bacterium]